MPARKLPRDTSLCPSERGDAARNTSAIAVDDSRYAIIGIAQTRTRAMAGF